jgi:ribA/ribD-fused uncharacterized protein
MENKKYKFFWDGKFSNWYQSPFKVDDITFNCGEQYMMYAKAMFFNDVDTAKEILETNVPAEQKGLGSKVKNYDDAAWNKVRFELVKKGLVEKFKQNEDLKKYLLSYKNYEIVEVSPYDRIWGIGYSEDEAMNNISDWGQNLLGKVLNEIATEL